MMAGQLTGGEPKRNWDMAKIQEAAFRCRLWQWLEEHDREISKRAFDEFVAIMGDEVV